MDICSEVLATPLRTLNSAYGWSCTPLPDGRALISAGRRYSDAEPVELFVSVSAEVVTLSDGGEAVSRLAMAGFDLEDDVHMAIWRDAIYQYRLGFADGIISLTASVETSAHAALRLADALVGLDALRLVAFPKGGRKTTFAETIEEYLRTTVGQASVQRSPSVTVGEITVRPTLRVRAKTADVYVQAAATTSWNTAFEHAFWTFSLFERTGSISVEQRLIVLGGSEATWGLPRIKMLSEVAYVGLWSERPSIDSFLNGAIPKDRILMA